MNDTGFSMAGCRCNVRGGPRDGANQTKAVCSKYCFRDLSPAIGAKQNVLTINLTVKCKLHSAVTAMSHALKDLLGQFDGVQRSLIFIYVGLEQGPTAVLYIADPPHGRQEVKSTYSSRNAVLIFLLLTLEYCRWALGV
jgi:hypothetical protein